MRELKFRAWDIVDKKMRFVSDLSFYITKERKFGFDVGVAIEDFDEPVYGDPNTEYIPMQYTGLKDKQGKEIYEGDIVKTSNAEIFEKVVYEAPEFKLVDAFGKFHINPLATPIHYEVIGNIYENPELLNNKD